MTTITLTMIQTKELYNELIAKTESHFKKIGISDAYINEFIMIIRDLEVFMLHNFIFLVLIAN